MIRALRFCASGEKFPRLCTEACPLYCANGNAKTCVAWELLSGGRVMRLEEQTTMLEENEED